MNRIAKNFVTVFLVVVYVLIDLGSLAPLALRTPSIARAMTGECIGDCNSCNCSPERRANHTCCCWLKKMKNRHEAKNVQECCKKKKRHKMPMLVGNCPCDRNNTDIWEGNDKTEHLPYRFSKSALALAENELYTVHRYHLTVRTIDPPDPPPKLSMYT